jgi:tRNA threonylcarbamoyladenosine biosynthesis protein TsaE
MMERFLSRGQKETSKLAKILAKVCLADSAFVAEATSAKEAAKRRRKILNQALVFGLVGELGSGKTTFIKGFAKGLGIKKRLTSPTFVLLKKHKNFYHIDCYRIKNPKDILDLDFLEIVSNPKNIIIIEWAERVKKILPKDTIWIKFKIISPKQREIKLL